MRRFSLYAISQWRTEPLTSTTSRAKNSSIGLPVRAIISSIQVHPRRLSSQFLLGRCLWQHSRNRLSSSHGTTSGFQQWSTNCFLVHYQGPSEKTSSVLEDCRLQYWSTGIPMISKEYFVGSISKEILADTVRWPSVVILKWEKRPWWNELVPGPYRVYHGL